MLSLEQEVEQGTAIKADTEHTDPGGRVIKRADLSETEDGAVLIEAQGSSISNASPSPRMALWSNCPRGAPSSIRGRCRKDRQDRDDHKGPAAAVVAADRRCDTADEEGADPLSEVVEAQPLKLEQDRAWIG